MVTAITMTHAGEAIGIARAAQAPGCPSSISFTVETDGALPTGQPLAEAIADGRRRDRRRTRLLHGQLRASDPLRRDARWTASALDGAHPRAAGQRVALSHAELDAAEELDDGDPEELGARYASCAELPQLTVLGGCCGTDHRHVEAIARACLA